jgi:hypothetical protein
MCTCRTVLHLHSTSGTQWFACHVYQWDDPTFGTDSLRVTCTCGTFLHLHPTCGTRRLACHLLPLGFNQFKLKKTMRPRSRTRDQDQGVDRLHHYARHLVMLTCLWSPNSSICRLCGYVDLYIGCIPYKWKQICTRWTCGGGEGGSLVCYGGSGILLEARWRVFTVESGGIGVRVCSVPRQRRQI